MDSWDLAIEIAEYVKNYGAKLTKEELTSAIDKIIREHVANY